MDNPIAFLFLLLALLLVVLVRILLIESVRRYLKARRILRRTVKALTFALLAVVLSVGFLVAGILIVGIFFRGILPGPPSTPVIPLATPTPSPSPTPIALLASVTISSEVQPNGTQKNVSKLSMNSIGVGEVLLTAPIAMDIEESAIVRLSITPDGALLALPSVASPIQNSEYYTEVLHADNRIDIYPVMKAELSSTNFEVSLSGDPIKLIVSDRPTEWIWNIKPKGEGLQTLTVVVSVPVVVDGAQEQLATTTLDSSVKNIPFTVTVSKSLRKRLEESSGPIVAAIGSVMVALIGLYGNRRQKEREQKIAQLEEQAEAQLKGRAEARKRLEEEIARLKEEEQEEIAELENQLTSHSRKITELEGAVAFLQNQRPGKWREQEIEKTQAELAGLTEVRKRLEEEIARRKQTPSTRRSEEQQKIAELEDQAKLDAEKKAQLQKEIARLKAIPIWQLWKR